MLKTSNWKISLQLYGMNPYKSSLFSMSYPERELIHKKFSTLHNL